MDQKLIADKPHNSPDYVFHRLKQPPIDLTCLTKLFPNLRKIFALGNKSYLLRARDNHTMQATFRMKSMLNNFAKLELLYLNLKSDYDSHISKQINFFFPKAKVLDLSYALYSNAPKVDIAKLFRDFKSLKGIICEQYLDCKLNANLKFEMLSTGFIVPSMSEINVTVKQLHLWCPTLEEFKEVAHYFPNLERLYVNRPMSYLDATDYGYNGLVLENLKIVEYADYDFTCCSFAFMDSCPALQSAHLKIGCLGIITFDDSIKRANLQDLVIQFREPPKRYQLSRAMSKYPNIKHLAIRNAYLNDEDIKQLILILPKLTLLDIRQSPGVTVESANHVQDYCKQYGRSIKFYFKKDDKQIESDWPQLLNPPDKICLGFDFMENCFFKDFDDLPHLLDPIDD